MCGGRFLASGAHIFSHFSSLARLVPVVGWTDDDDHGSTAISITVVAEWLINPLPLPLCSPIPRAQTDIEKNEWMQKTKDRPDDSQLGRHLAFGLIPSAPYRRISGCRSRLPDP